MAIQSQSLSLLNAEDVAALRQLIEREKRRPQNQPGPPDALSEDNERSVVFAYVPAGGIPARTSGDSSTGTGTPVSTGTGTAILNTGDYTLYGVECQMYREEWDDLVTTQAGSGTSSADAISATARRVLKAVEGWTELVFNPEATALSGSRLVPTTISPWGSRIPIGQGSAGVATDIIRFQVTCNSPFIREGYPPAFCIRVTGEVLSVICGGGSSVSVGDELTIWDPEGVFFNVPLDILLESTGVAVKMAWTAPNGMGCSCHKNMTDEEIAALPYAGECWWMVVSMSCVEEWADSPY